MSTYRKDVTDEEVARALNQHLDELMPHVVHPKPGGSQKEQRRQEAPKATKTRAPEEREPSNDMSAGVDESVGAYLRSIVTDPNLTTTQRRDFLGLSTYMSNQLKQQALDADLATQLTLNLGASTRGLVKVLQLTDKGYRALEQTPPTRAHANVSPEHAWWQRAIATSYQSRGYRAEVEHSLNGKRADVAVFTTKGVIAIEVGMRADNEVVNAKQDLTAGYRRVVLACQNARVRAAVEQRLQAAMPAETLARVKVMLLSEFEFVQELLGKRPPRRTTTALTITHHASGGGEHHDSSID